MYSGTTLHNKSGAIVGAHQNINRVAYKRLKKSMQTQNFPELQEILHFEGNNGPDGIKRKSPNKHEPMHFCDPDNPHDNHVHHTVQDHYDNLVKHLKSKNKEKAAFEASWLAHAVVDGLTPAHHFPYHAAVTELRNGNENYSNLFEKLIFRGETVREMATKNWSFWGAKGLLMSHSTFEWGVAALALLRPSTDPITKNQLQTAKTKTASEHYDCSLHEIAQHDMFSRFYETGWSLDLARQVNDVLLPQLIETVSLLWASALHEAGMTGKVYA
jgi:hypothetical protein